MFRWHSPVNYKITPDCTSVHSDRVKFQLRDAECVSVSLETNLSTWHKYVRLVYFLSSSLWYTYTQINYNGDSLCTYQYSYPFRKYPNAQCIFSITPRMNEFEYIAPAYTYVTQDNTFFFLAFWKYDFLFMVRLLEQQIK